MELNFNDESECQENVETNSENFSNRYRLPRANKFQSKQICAKEQRNATLRKIATILQKNAADRTADEEKILLDSSVQVEEVLSRWKKRDEVKKRMEEYEDPPELLKTKCEKLAQAIAQSQHLVVYTGAGISTSAKIPDYRGPNGIWTRLQQGKDIGNHDLSLAEPTYTHMALYELYKRNVLKYVVSQNCDGLHLRSGLPKTALSELHGNMYLEVCKNCKPHVEYWRTFDVTENTSRYFHKTSRKCYMCNSPLEDTIVHFGERGKLQWPLNWKGACQNARKATTILCLGSSLKVLKKYPWLWQMDKPVKRRPNLYIVNLQWTPKDDCANQKINGRCDEVMKAVMTCLGISPPSYDRSRDPIYFHCSKLSVLEMHTTSQPFLKDTPIEEIKKEEPSEPQVQSEGNDKDCIENCNNDLLQNNTHDFCDKKINSNKSNEDCQEVKAESNQFSSAFSIRSILENSSVQTNSISSISDSQQINNFGSLVTFMHMNNGCNRFFQNDYIYYTYPYQSSWLYSGLHSIINTVPYSKEAIKVEKIEVSSPKPSCEYCYDHLKSFSCLFYPPTEAVFVKQQVRYSKIEKINKPNICVCCDYTTDEEDNKDQTDKNKVQPGWFGKGYKKRRRK
ncbi:NAD-dependent protein deacetylase sirtuin-7 [Harmonia axyridis]|uniref:NAD-dependent protein deacetylase sirtuin-7 n=1 Tax=Harmonia axyridis TaxID=115357 RepID=UPI001E27722C|nr:NAD-dependent protein deacetylase sirtuin-7 [Harmonia axyridis]